MAQKYRDNTMQRTPLEILQTTKQNGFPPEAIRRYRLRLHQLNRGRSEDWFRFSQPLTSLVSQPQAIAMPSHVAFLQRPPAGLLCVLRNSAGLDLCCSLGRAPGKHEIFIHSQLLEEKEPKGIRLR